MTLGAAGTVVCLLPVFLTGAMAVQLTRSLGFGTVGLGAAVALSRVSAAIASPFSGRLADQLGATQSIRLATGVAAGTSLGIALTAGSWLTFVPWLMLSGCTHALVQPAANRLLSNAVQPGRLGRAFGFKQSAPPATSMLAGASVPLLALTFGWRWAFVVAAALAAITSVSARQVTPRTERAKAARSTPEPLGNRRILVLLAAAFGLGSATSSATTTFYVASAVPAGTSPQLAGVMLATASLAALAVRIAAGFVSDRMAGGHLRLCAGLVGVGAIGLVLLATDDPTWMAVGVAIALLGVWGFNGVFWFALVRAYPKTPGQLTGAIAPGVLLGSTAGPLLFGVIADSAGYPMMWLLVALLALAAAGGMLASSRHLPAPELSASA